MAAMPLSMTRRDTFASPMFTFASVGASRKPSSAICKETLISQTHQYLYLESGRLPQSSLTRHPSEHKSVKYRLTQGKKYSLRQGKGKATLL